jgi:myosin heavy subunit
MKRVPKLSKKKRDALAGAKNAAASAALSADEQQQQQDNFELYSKNLLVWVKNPYKKKSRLSEGDARLLQGLPPYDSDPVYRAEWLSQRKSLRPVWVQARVVSVDRATMMVNVETVRCHPTKTMSVPLGSGFPSTPFIVNEQSDAPSASGINNMVDMAQLHEASLLHNIEKRFHHRQIYTYAGDTLIAVNPYELISLSAPYWSKIADKCGMRLSMQGLSASSVDIYHAAVQQEYIKCPSPTALEEMPAEKRKKYAMPPHVFEVAHETFHALTTDVGGAPRAQSVVISGESGAGKTATTKLILSYLTALSSQKGAGAAASARQQTRRRTSVVANEFKLKGLDEVSKQILESNHILEAFGNAKTLRNDNSSRFGKYIKLFFADASSVGGSTLSIVSATITPYLLEKVRVILQNEGERNYHVFYMMAAGLSKVEKARCGLRSIDEYKLLTQSSVREVHDMDDREEFEKMRRAMRTSFKVEDSEEVEVYQLMAGVLALGNMEFEGTGSDSSRISKGSIKELDAVSTALGIDRDALNHALCYIELVDHTGKVIMRELPPEKATGSALSAAKMVYERVFKWMVEHINSVMGATSERLFGNLTIPPTSYIGILDIFGFEVFEVNSFEQLCINFANEKLQAFYVRHVFDLERVLYEKEGIDFDEFTYTSNKKIIALLDRPRKPPGVFAMLDEAVLFPKSTDVSLFNSIVKQHKKHAHFGVIKSVAKKAGQSRDSITEARARAQLSFTVKHSATDVAYYINGFLEKNKDRLPPNLDRLLDNASVPLLAKVCRLAKAQAPKGSKSTKGKFAGSTLGAKFVSDIANLMTSLEATNPHFVRCIKPNNAKSPKPISPTLVHHQLCYLGVLNAIKLRHSGFSFRQEYDMFYERFIIVCAGSLPWPPPAGADMRDLCKQMMVHLNKLLHGRRKLAVKADFQYGRTKIFFRNQAIVRLESLREDHLRKMDAAATQLQRWWCSMAGANMFHRMRLSFMRFQAAFRACGVRDQYLHRTKAVGVIQRAMERRRKKLKFAGAVRAITGLQRNLRHALTKRRNAARRRGVAALRAAARGLVVREQMLRLVDAVKTLQRTVRRWRAEYALYWAKVKCALLVQAVTRGRLLRRNRADLMAELALRKRARKFGAAVGIIEQLYKSKLIRARFAAVKAATLTLQAFCHVVADRNRWLRRRRALALLQRVARGAAARDIVGGMVRANIIADEMFRLKQVSFIYRYILRESCSQFDSLPLTSLTIHLIRNQRRAGARPRGEADEGAARAHRGRRGARRARRRGELDRSVRLRRHVDGGRAERGSRRDVRRAVVDRHRAERGVAQAPPGAPVQAHRRRRHRGARGGRDGDLRRRLVARRWRARVAPQRASAALRAARVRRRAQRVTRGGR